MTFLGGSWRLPLYCMGEKMRLPSFSLTALGSGSLRQESENSTLVRALHSLIAAYTSPSEMSVFLFFSAVSMGQKYGSSLPPNWMPCPQTAITTVSRGLRSPSRVLSSRRMLAEEGMKRGSRAPSFWVIRTTRLNPAPRSTSARTRTSFSVYSRGVSSELLYLRTPTSRAYFSPLGGCCAGREAGRNSISAARSLFMDRVPPGENHVRPL